MSNLNNLVNSLSDEQIIKIVTSLGSDDYINTEQYIQFKTICHNKDCQDASMKLYYYKKNKKFHCYTDCDCNFNLIELFKKRYNLLGIKYDFYKDIVLKLPIEQTSFSNTKNFLYKYNSEMSKFNNYSFNNSFKHYDKNILNAFIEYPVKEWLEDGINENIMSIYGIKYDISTNKVIIPHYDINNNLIGIRGRDLNINADNKYMPIIYDNEVYSHPLSFNLYGLNLVKDNIKKYQMAIIAEGEKSCMQYGTMFGMNKNICVATCGSNIQQTQIDLLIQNGANKILIAFDKEGENFEKREQHYQKLKRFCLKYKNKVQMGFIWDTNNLLSLKESPFDKGKEIFLKLYKQAIWI